jgi:hypothetical protein
VRKTLVMTILAALAAAAILVSGKGACADTPVEDATVFKNVEVLKHVKSKSEMRRIMKEQAASLGVKCSHCHVPGKFDLDEKKPKKIARDMMKMVEALNATTFKDTEIKVSCWTCHRGEEEPTSAVPPEAFLVLDEQK